MNRSYSLRLLVFGLWVSLVAVGCVKKRQIGVTPIPKNAPLVSGQGPGGLIETAPSRAPTVPNPSPVTQEPLKPDTGGGGIPLTGLVDFVDYWGDTNFFKGETVYFDRAVVKPSETGKAIKVADYLKGNASHKVQVDGHCDERGTEEYNRSLGERRALAVREHLIRLGIAPERIRTLSWGEDRPVDTGHNEEAWQKNRRAEFILLKPKQP